MESLLQIRILIWMVFISKVVATDVIQAEIQEVTTESVLVVFNGTENISDYRISVNRYGTPYLLRDVKDFLEVEQNITNLASNKIYRIDISSYLEDVHANPIFVKTLPKVSDVKITGLQIEYVKNDSLTIAWDAIDTITEYAISYDSKVEVYRMAFSTNNSKVMYEITGLRENTEYEIQVSAQIQGLNINRSSSIIKMRTLIQVNDIRNIGLEVFEDSCDLNWLATGGYVTIKVENDVYVTKNNYITLWDLDRNKTVHTVRINSNSINVTLTNAKRSDIKFVHANGASKDSLSIKWELKKDYYYYVLEWKAANNNSNFQSVMVSTNIASLTDLRADTEYIIQVSAIFGYSMVRSKQVKMKTLSTAEDKVVNIIAKVYTRSVQLVWSDSIPTGKSIYEVSVEGDPTKTINTTKNYATIENIVDSAALHTFIVKLVSINNEAPASVISGSVTIDIKEKAGETTYIPSFKILKRNNFYLTWERIKDSYSYTVKSVNLNTTESNSVIVMLSKIRGSQYSLYFRTQPNTLYKFVVETNDEVKIRSRELIYKSDSAKIQLKIVNVFEDGFDISWTDKVSSASENATIITEPAIDQEFITYYGQGAYIWYVPGPTIRVTVSIGNRESETVVVTLSKAKRELLDRFKITEVSESGLTTYKMLNYGVNYGNNDAEKIFDEYIFFFEKDKNNLTRRKLVSTQGKRETFNVLASNTNYLVWFEVYHFYSSLAKRSKVWSITTLTKSVVPTINNLRVVNTYQESFDVQWDKPVYPKEYELSVQPKELVTYIRNWERSASVFITNVNTDTEFEVFLHFKLNDTFRSIIVKVRPGIEGNGLTRPVLYAWIEKEL